MSNSLFEWVRLVTHRFWSSLRNVWKVQDKLKFVKKMSSGVFRKRNKQKIRILFRTNFWREHLREREKEILIRILEKELVKNTKMMEAKDENSKWAFDVDHCLIVHDTCFLNIKNVRTMKFVIWKLSFSPRNQREREREQCMGKMMDPSWEIVSIIKLLTSKRPLAFSSFLFEFVVLLYFLMENPLSVVWGAF